MLPAEGVGAFVYDKRGTGASGGSYSQDFSLLADDAVAATREAKRLAGPRAGRIGYQGGSEGGWVAPLAANRAPVDFVIVCFGLAVTVIEEDQEEVALEMREEGHTPAEIVDALKVARAAETVMADGLAQGFREFDALRAKISAQPTGLVQGSARQLHLFLPALQRSAAARDGTEVPLGHAVSLRAHADIARRHDAAIVDIGKRGL